MFSVCRVSLAHIEDNLARVNVKTMAASGFNSDDEKNPGSLFSVLKTEQLNSQIKHVKCYECHGSANVLGQHFGETAHLLPGAGDVTGTFSQTAFAYFTGKRRYLNIPF